jgi:hypothetical protein
MTAVCSWCSTPITEGMTECPSCGANLIPDGDPNVPGLTAVDAASIIRSKSPTQPRSRLMSWLSGEYTTDLPSKAEQQAIAPPDLEVRREILRLELEAEVANLQAEADALRAEAVADGRSGEVEALDAAIAAAAAAGEGTSAEDPIVTDVVAIADKATAAEASGDEEPDATEHRETTAG